MDDPDLLRPEQCLSANLRRAARVAAGLFRAPMRETGLGDTQFTLLAAIGGMGPCSPGELGSWLGMDQTTVSRSVALVARSGWVEVSGDPADGRVRLLSLSDEGRAVLERALEQWTEGQQEVLARFGEERARELLALLNEFVAAAKGEPLVKKSM